MNEYFFNMKLCNCIKTILFLDEKTNIHQNSMKVRVTYSHYQNIIKSMERIGIIHTEKIGRIIKIRFTDEGKQVREHLSALNELFKQAYT